MSRKKNRHQLLSLLSSINFEKKRTSLVLVSTKSLIKTYPTDKRKKIVVYFFYLKLAGYPTRLYKSHEAHNNYTHRILFINIKFERGLPIFYNCPYGVDT
uniref:Uncharacterized protein n=1 Tax=Cacopsylla melanoneura TaxID=428564 RepID=A0A8D8XP41_9HEMI